MAEPPSLGERLRALRTDHDLTQRDIAAALAVSNALISSWESETATPPESRLREYALLFATQRGRDQETDIRMLREEDLEPDELARMHTLAENLIRLREQLLPGSSGRVTPHERGALGGKFWHFPDGQPITILCTPLSDSQLGYEETAGSDGQLPPAVQYATNPTHPNAVRNLRNGDIDALLDLVGHIRAENPTSEVRWLTFDAIASDVQLTGHLVILGGGDANSPEESRTPVEFFMASLGLPVRAETPPGADDEFGGVFVVTRLIERGDERGDPVKETHETFEPRFVRLEARPDKPLRIVKGAPQLRADLALIARKPHPFNDAATTTVLTGIFSRGTHGAVRAFTDPNFRARNEQWLEENLDPDDFWMLVEVPVSIAETTVAPDLNKRSTRLATS